jgi:hypothetical protein
VSPLRLYGVVAFDGADGGGQLAPGTDLVSFRDLAALVAETPHARPALASDDLLAYRGAVDAAFAQRAVLPAPAGVVFRARDALVNWLELHYVTLSDALGFVEGRATARVHVSRPDGARVTLADGRTDEMGLDVGAIAAESFRVLRRHSAASIMLRGRPDEIASASASFLVERDKWRLFEDVVAEEGRRDPEVVYRMTGPWPPYDFVRMQFGG